MSVILLKLFNLSQNYAVDRPVLKFDFCRYTPPSVNLVNGEKTKFLLIYLEKIVLFH